MIILLLLNQMSLFNEKILLFFLFILQILLYFVLKKVYEPHLKY